MGAEAAAPPPIIEFRNASYSLPNGHTLLKNLNLAISGGETLALLGRSGAGKTTALRMVNRLLEATSGEVRVEDRPTTAWDAIQLRRRAGYVIQETGLFPHYTVGKNVGLVPHMEKWPAAAIHSRVDELLKLVGLDPAYFRGRYPRELSGGQRQRVGVARALAADPPILLMDEPFGALDPLTRSDLRNEFQQLQHRLRKTIILVTHDTTEALLLGDRIALMEAGELRGVFSPHEFLHSDEPVAAAYASQLRALENSGRNR